MYFDLFDFVFLILFLGCDYTIGVHGIGIVNALEAIKVFNTFESLEEFKNWAIDPGRIKLVYL